MLLILAQNKQEQLGGGVFKSTIASVYTLCSGILIMWSEKQKHHKKRSSLGAGKLTLPLKIILPASPQEQLRRVSARGFFAQTATEQSLDVFEAVYFYLVEIFFLPPPPSVI